MIQVFQTIYWAGQRLIAGKWLINWNRIGKIAGVGAAKIRKVIKYICNIVFIVINLNRKFTYILRF